MINPCEVHETKKRNTYRFIRSKADLGKVPDPIRRKLEPLGWFKTVDLDEALLEVDLERLEAELETYGYSVVSIETKFHAH